MFTNSNDQVSDTFTIIGLIAESTLKFINNTRGKIFGNPILEMTAAASSDPILKHSLQITAIKNVFK